MKYLTVRQACKEYSVSKSTIFKLLRNGHLNRYVLPDADRKTFISREEFEQLFRVKPISSNSTAMKK